MWVTKRDAASLRWIPPLTAVGELSGAPSAGNSALSKISTVRFSKKSKGCGGLTPQELLNLATQDRFALIFDEEYEGPVMENIRELYQLCPTTGILVRQTAGGETYHVAPA